MAMVCGVLIGCGDAATGDEGTADLGLPLEGESQCGSTWDVQDVEQYDGTLGVTTDWVQRHEGAVGYQLFPGCSGTLISNDLFLSAGHCNYTVGQTIRFNYQEDPSGALRPTQDFSVTEIVEQEDNGTWDYAIVRLSGNPGQTFGYARLADRDEAANELVAIIGHPAGVPKVIHAGNVHDYSSPLGANWFRHQVDTTGGSSGAGVLSADGFLVGVHTNAGCNISGDISGNSAMRITSLIDHSTTLQQVLAAQRGAHGWVWANQPASASYTPSLSYQFNSSGATNTITRSGAGVYQVRYPGLGHSTVSGVGTGGNVQVVAYDPGAYCKVASWSGFGTDASVNVRCFTYAGAPVDAMFVALFHRSTFEGFRRAHATSGYLWSQSASYAAVTSASSLYSGNEAGQLNTISQTGTGRYVATLPGVDAFDASVLVTAYGSGSERCQVSSWGSSSDGMRVHVACSAPNGTAADSRFTLAFTGGGVPGRLATGDNAGAYAWANQPSSASYTPSTWYQGNLFGANVTIDRSAVGTYLVRVPRSVSVSRDAVLVTAYGSTGHHCLVDHWSRLATETSARVLCFNGAGSPVDTYFTLSYLTSNSFTP